MSRELNAAPTKSTTRPSRPRAAQAPRDHVRTRKVKDWVQNILWGRAAGRCQFKGCNRPLWKSPVTQETRNLAEKAHIYAFSKGGPRATTDWPPELLNDVDNLLLVCQDCHETIDKADGPERYSAARLQEWKQQHEDRVEIATGVASRRRSHVVVYGTPVGRHLPLPTFKEAGQALFPRRFPAERRNIELGTWSGAPRDHDAAFWAEQRRDLERHVEQRLQARIHDREICHLSVFAIAPQLLLIQLGVLIGDITDAETYQLHREPAGWAWPADGETLGFQVREPTSNTGRPALVFSISATITADRITKVLGEDVSIWEVTVAAPNNDVVKARETLARFRETVRPLLDRIKAAHGHGTPIHVFPAMPVSLAVEFGRIRMPKADAPWELYDEHPARGGFAHAFTL